MFAACSRPPAPDRPGGGQRGPGHQRGRLVHAREDRVVGGAEPVPAVGPGRPGPPAGPRRCSRRRAPARARRRRRARGGQRHVGPVQHAELAGQRHRQLDPHRRQRMPGPEVVPGQSSSQASVSEPPTIRPEFAAAVAGRLDRGQERGPHPVPLQLPDRGDRRPARRGDRLAQDHRVLAGLAQHGRRAVHRLDDHLQRGAARHPEQDARRPPWTRPGSTRRRARCRTAPSRRPAATRGSAAPCRPAGAAPRPGAGAPRPRAPRPRSRSSPRRPAPACWTSPGRPAPRRAAAAR